MTAQVSAADTRQLLPGIKRAKIGCHEVSKGVAVEVIEEQAWKDHSHIRGSFPDGEPLFEKGFETGPIYSFYCADSYVDVRSGTTIVDNQVVREPVFRSYVFPGAEDFDDAIVSDPKRVVLPLASVRMKNYCRYWTDSIAKLYVCERSSGLRALVGAGAAHVVAPKLKLPFQRQAADLIEAHAPIRIQKKARLVRGRSLNATGIVFGGQHVGRIVRDFSDHLRSIVPELTPPDPSSSGLLYVSRNEAKMRRLLNEEAILPALRDLGFEIIRPGEMPLATQIEKFRKAKVVLAPHGAGLTNILFCRPDVTLIEIFPRGGVHGSMFMRIASQREFDYYFVVGDSVGTVWSENNPNNADVVLDAEPFISFVRQVI
ncbi:MAG: capsular polysaccharide biosynthesis protein-like protein [Reyranella sp.]|nr:capsular polysaccharide biosynthesis protein-like protein [Reyranella sp.]